MKINLTKLNKILHTHSKFNHILHVIGEMKIYLRRITHYPLPLGPNSSSSGIGGGKSKAGINPNLILN